MLIYLLDFLATTLAMAPAMTTVAKFTMALASHSFTSIL